MCGKTKLDGTFQTRSQNSRPNTLGSMHMYIYIYICAVLSLCYVQA